MDFLCTIIVDLRETNMIMLNSSYLLEFLRQVFACQVFNISTLLVYSSEYKMGMSHKIAL